MSRESIRRGVERATTLSTAVLLALTMCAFAWPWDLDRGWPSGSDVAVSPLDCPTLESRTGADASPESGFRFVAYGDQRALVDGEWQALVARVAALAETDPGLLFVVDTGDIANDGRHSNQFAFLGELLEPLRPLPYLVAAGNHEVDANRDPAARRNTARFLSGMDPVISPDRLYFRKDVGALRLLFLDTNDLVYGDHGDEVDPPGARAGSRAETQLRWLEAQLANDDRGPDALTVAVLHHPFLQSSRKHRHHAIALWSYRWQGRTLPQILIEGGVDVVLAGHTHTTERFRVRRDSDGAEFRLINLSGRPRGGFLWFGDESRRARDIAGREAAWLGKRGWRELDGWTITQEHAMTKKEADQFGLFHVGPKGGLRMETVYVARDGLVRRDPAVRLH